MNKGEISEQIVEYVRRNHNSRSDKLMELIAAYDGERAIAESQGKEKEMSNYQRECLVDGSDCGSTTCPRAEDDKEINSCEPNAPNAENVDGAAPMDTQQSANNATPNTTETKPNFAESAEVLLRHLAQATGEPTKQAIAEDALYRMWIGQRIDDYAELGDGEASPKCKSCKTVLYRTLGETGEYCDQCGAAQEVSPPPTKARLGRTYERPKIEIPCEAGEEVSSHQYISTACLHGQHEKCRRFCKYCKVPCACKGCAHVEEVSPPSPEPPRLKLQFPSKECARGRHSECTETADTCNCTCRGGHKTPHRYAEMLAEGDTRELKAALRWIPIEEKWPELNAYVWFWVPSLGKGGNWETGYYRDSPDEGAQFECERTDPQNGYIVYDDQQISHWMLAELPKPDGSD